MKSHRYMRLLNVLYVIAILITVCCMVYDMRRESWARRWVWLLVYSLGILIWTIIFDVIIWALRYIFTWKFDLRIWSKIKWLFKNRK